MKLSPLILNVFLCILMASLTLAYYIEQQNHLTELRLSIPALAKEIKELREENSRLQYEINQFESPAHLLELAQKPEFGHLKYPTLDQVKTFPKQENPHE